MYLKDFFVYLKLENITYDLQFYKNSFRIKHQIDS